VIRKDAIKCRFCQSDLTTAEAMSKAGKAASAKPVIDYHIKQDYTPEERARLDKQNKIVLTILGALLIGGLLIFLIETFKRGGL
jgi:hypothetical protein